MTTPFGVPVEPDAALDPVIISELEHRATRLAHALPVRTLDMAADCFHVTIVDFSYHLPVPNELNQDRLAFPFLDRCRLADNRVV